MQKNFFVKSWIFVILMLCLGFVSNSYAFTNGSSENIGENVFAYGNGILGFQEGQCKDITANAVVHKIDLAKDPPLNIDGADKTFFLVLADNDTSFQYWQVDLPSGSGAPAYLLDFKKEDQRVRGEFYVDYQNLAVVVESDSSEVSLPGDSYQKYFAGASKDVTYSTHSFGPGRYDFGAILFMSDSTSWINHDTCAVRFDYATTVGDDGKFSLGDFSVVPGLLHDVTLQFLPLQQYRSGVNPDSIQCKPGLQMIMHQTSDSSKPACVKPDTAEKLAQRGWFKTELSINNTGSQGITSDSIKTVSDFKDVSFRSQTVDSLFSKFGQPDSDIGSGIHIYVYKLDDSSQIWIGYTDRVLYVAHMDSSGNSLEQLYSENEN